MPQHELSRTGKVTKDPTGMCRTRVVQCRYLNALAGLCTAAPAAICDVRKRTNHLLGGDFRVPL